MDDTLGSAYNIVVVDYGAKKSARCHLTVTLNTGPSAFPIWIRQPVPTMVHADQSENQASGESFSYSPC